MVRSAYAAVILLGACNVSLSGPRCDVEAIDRTDTTGKAGPGAPGNARGAAEAPAACPGPRGTGTTPCSGDGCGPGQMCDQSGLPECRPGCSSDEHCARTDQCVRPAGETVGRCERCDSGAFGEPAPGCVDAGRTGVTDCFHDCGPGTYCRDVGIPECVPGCVTDGNCGPTERCERPGTSKVGTCTSCYAPVP